MSRITRMLASRNSFRLLPVFFLLAPTFGKEVRTPASAAPGLHHAAAVAAVIRCGAASSSTVDCKGQLPVGWQAQTNKAQLFSKILKTIETSADERYGVRGGVVKNVQGGKQRWKMVEPLEDANHVDISDLKSPVVIGRLRHLRGASESMGNGLKKGDNVAFVVVYPDVFTETPDVNDTNADQHSSYRIVKLKYIAKRPVIDVGPALRDFTPCHVKPNDESSALHPQRLNAQAQFATCASSMISAEEFAGFFAMTVDSARRIAADSSNIVRSVAVSELVRAYDAEKARAVETHRSFGRSNYLEWVGTEGLWFTCGLGCCYAKPVTN